MRVSVKILLLLGCICHIALNPLDSSGDAPHMLRGRIEEVSGPGGARLPELKTLIPKLDLRQQGQSQPSPNPSGTTSNLSATQRSHGSYPINWQGTWEGQLKIVSAKYVEPVAPVLKHEIDIQRRANAPGRSGKASFRFAHTPPNQVSLEPVTIEFAFPNDLPLPPAIKITEQNASRLLGDRSYAYGDYSLEPTRTYYMSMNNVAAGITVGGNIVSQKVLRNDVKELAPKVIEQDIITYGTEEIRNSRQHFTSYNEDVLRFTMMSDRTMMVQAVSLSYDARGKCDTSISLVGYVYRI